MESLMMSRQEEDTPNAVWALSLLANVALYQGDYDLAEACYQESLPLAQQLRHARIVEDGLVGLGAVAHARGQLVRAARLLAAGAAQGQRAGKTPSSTATPDAARFVDTVRAQLDGATFAVAWAEGWTMTVEEAITYALTQESSPAQ
ncbi:MAG: tetratricopeptide repeat protein, partial [Chloroflexota bacterium]|nr:tetratricopeptide repeat protein [Chloroflexota bacterium]